MTDPLRYPVEKLAELYFRRWSIELFYRDLKTTVHLEVMRTTTPAMVEKEMLEAIASVPKPATVETRTTSEKTKASTPSTAHLTAPPIPRKPPLGTLPYFR